MFKPEQLAVATGSEEVEEESDISAGYSEKHALLVGCTYLGLKGHLKGVARDIYRTYDWLQKAPMNIPAENIVVLSDDPACAKACKASGKPTQANIKAAMSMLALKSGPGTLQVMLYSGHGGNIPGTDESFETCRSEKSGRKKDQALIPINHKDKGLDDYGCVRDNWIMEKFLMKMHKESTCFFIADCCHSGTIADLPYEYMLQPSPHVKRVGPLVPEADCFVFAGCRDDQCSQDLGSRVGGALTSNILPLLSGWRVNQAGNPPCQDFLARLRKRVCDATGGNKSQTPVLCSSLDLSSSMQLPLDQPRQRYQGDTRGSFDDEFEELEEEEVEEGDAETDAMEIERWDYEEDAADADEADLEGEDWGADEDSWADYEAPTGKGVA